MRTWPIWTRVVIREVVLLVVLHTEAATTITTMGAGVVRR